MRLYLMVEVEILQKMEDVVKEKDVKSKDALVAERKRKLCFETEDVPNSLREYVFRDFLRPLKRPSASKLSVERRHGKLHLAVSTALLIHKGPISQLADFCIANSDLTEPADVAARIAINSDLRERVLAAESVRIATFLGTKDTERMRLCLAGFVEGLRAATGHRRACLTTEILRLGGGPGWDADPACARRVQRYMRYIRMSVHDTATKIVHFHRTRNDVPARTTLLEEALRNRGLHIRGDSKFCKEFIRGTIDVDAEEVASIMDITDYLFEEGGHIAYSNCSGEAEEECINSVFELGESWNLGVRRAMSLASSLIEKRGRHWHYGRDRDW